jgi:hypothetical protein
MQKRKPKGKEITCVDPETTFGDLKKRLHTSRVPDRLPCREDEFNDIYYFLESKLKEGVGGLVVLNPYINVTQTNQPTCSDVFTFQVFLELERQQQSWMPFKP